MKKHQGELFLGLAAALLAGAAGKMAADLGKMQLKEILDRCSLAQKQNDGSSLITESPDKASPDKASPDKASPDKINPDKADPD